MIELITNFFFKAKTRELDQQLPFTAEIRQTETYGEIADFVEESFRYERAVCPVNEEFKGSVIKMDTFPEILITKSDFVMKRQDFTEKLK